MLNAKEANEIARRGINDTKVVLLDFLEAKIKERSEQGYFNYTYENDFSFSNITISRAIRELEENGYCISMSHIQTFNFINGNEEGYKNIRISWNEFNIVDKQDA